MSVTFCGVEWRRNVMRPASELNRTELNLTEQLILLLIWSRRYVYLSMLFCHRHQRLNALHVRAHRMQYSNCMVLQIDSQKFLCFYENRKFIASFSETILNLFSRLNPLHALIFDFCKTSFSIGAGLNIRSGHLCWGYTIKMLYTISHFVMDAISTLSSYLIVVWVLTKSLSLWYNAL